MPTALWRSRVGICPAHCAWFDSDELPVALERLKLERIRCTRARDLEHVSTEEYWAIRLYRLFRPFEPPSVRRRGRW